MEKRGKGREKKWVINLQLASTQKPKNFVKEINVLYINNKDVTSI